MRLALDDTKLTVLFFVGALVAAAVVDARLATSRGSEDAEPDFRAHSDAALRAQLTAEQYEVTQHHGTEAAYHNAYWDNDADGVYVDVITGEPLFCSLDKVDGGDGRPSFSRPLQAPPEAAAPVAGGVALREDDSDGSQRTEVVTRLGGTHLGFLLDDPGRGERYQLNSAALRFVALDRLHEAGLGRLVFLFAARRGWQVATLAGGCFWGMEAHLARLPGVVETQVGYTGGFTPHPTYAEVSQGDTGHAEAIEVLFDPAQLSYEDVLLFFFRLHDPTTRDAQGNDVGPQYRSAIFCADAAQCSVAAAARERVARSNAWGAPLTTQIVNLGPFTRAEPEHQRYLDHNPGGPSCHTVRPFAF